MFKRRMHESSTGERPTAGYPVKMLGKFAVDAREKSEAPVTTERLIDRACMAVKYTQKANSIEKTIILGELATAANDNARNGSIFTLIGHEQKMQNGELLKRLMSGADATLVEVDRVGVYAISDKKRATAADVSGLGFTLACEDGTVVNQIEMTRQDLDVLPQVERQQLRGMLDDIAEMAFDVYGYRVMRMAH